MLRARLLTLSILFGLFLAGQAEGRELRVMISGGFSAAYQILAPRFEKASGNSLVMIKGPSMGNDPTAIPNRLDHGEPADVVIMVRSGLDSLAAKNLVLEDSSRDLGVGIIAAAVKAGAPKPDIRTVASLKKTLVAAKSVAFSDSASGVYLSTQLFPRLRLAAVMAKKATKIQATPVGLKVASGEYELGFQQLSELKPIRGIDVIGPIPQAVQQYTLFAAAIASKSDDRADACALISFLSSSKARQAIEASGMLLPRPPTKPLSCGLTVDRVN